MATIIPTLAFEPDGRTRIYHWEGITQADEGGAIRITPGYADKTILIHGTFDTGTYTLECSVDNVNFVPARNAQGGLLQFTSTDDPVVGSNGWYWRIANDNAGTTEAVDVYLVCVLG